jgi:hypothetical protein
MDPHKKKKKNKQASTRRTWRREERCVGSNAVVLKSQGVHPPINGEILLQENQHIGLNWMICYHI